MQSLEDQEDWQNPSKIMKLYFKTGMLKVFLHKNFRFSKDLRAQIGL